ncbi:MAG TPA: hypothetical protein VN493_28675 [Thermoanaerobaculia bacterium]|nr:hypothetical protein [Thermoanaerobaculia bacterium]
MAGSSSAAARVPVGRLGDAALLKRFATAFDLSPRPVTAGREVLEPLYAKLPGRFPPLFEQLVTGYTWDGEVDLGDLRLLPNPLDVSGQAGPVGSIIFAIGPDGAWVCFDLERRRNDRDCPVVREGEEIAPSFKALMERLAG